MSRLICPHCGKPGISVMRKMCLGPAIPAMCKACGKKVGVPYIAMLAAIPFLVAIVGSALAEPFALKAALWVDGFLVMAILHMRWVPLEPQWMKMASNNGMQRLALRAAADAER